MFRFFNKHSSLILDVVVAGSLVAALIVNRAGTHHFLLGLATGIAVLKIFVGR